MTGWRRAVAGLLLLGFVVGILFSGALVLAVLLVAIAIAVAYAVRVLMAGQSEWFGREERRREQRGR
jgi:hypothetical protein